MKVFEFIKRNVIQSLNKIEVTKETAVIFDIDNTLINKYAKIIDEIADIYKECEKKGITIMIVTSRPAIPDSITYTQNQLHEHNLNGYQSIYFMKPNRTDVGLYKYNARKHIFERGYKVIYSFGDMDTDGLNCVYAGNFIKIPLQYI